MRGTRDGSTVEGNPALADARCSATVAPLRRKSTGRHPDMATASETPVLDTLAAMTVDSIERCGLAPDMLLLTRIAALAASDAPPISYMAHIGPAMETGVTAAQLQD